MFSSRRAILTLALPFAVAGCGVNHKTPDITPLSGTFASTSLCGDSYLLALKPEQISALSWQSRSDLSTATDAQKALPQISDRAEDVMAYKDAAIVFGPGEGFKTSKYAGTSIALKWGEDFKTVWENMELIGAGSSHAWKARLEAIPMQTSTPQILYLSRAGGTAGPGTFVDAVITAAGGENIIKTKGWFTPDPETLMAQSPDVILTSFFDSEYASVNDKSYRHKAVREFIDSHPRIDLPGSLWPCAGPGLVEAAEQLSAALREREI